MTIATSSLRWLNHLRLNAPRAPDAPLNNDTVMTPAALEAYLTRNPLRLGPEGLAALRAVYREASVNGPPTYRAMREVVNVAERQLANERARGRVNDGFIDAREGGSVRSAAAQAAYTWLAKKEPAVTRTDTGRTASRAQLDSAMQTLGNAVDAGFRRFAGEPQKTWPKLVAALRQSAAAQGLPRAAVDTLIIAANGVAPRGSGGALGTEGLPTAATVKAALARARDNLLAADGALIVDFEAPQRAPASVRDGAVSELEIERTPRVQGKAARSLLEYASGL